MSYTFRVIFDGVCAYVPDRPFFKEAPGPDCDPRHTDGMCMRPIRSNPEVESLAVLLPDLRRSGRAHTPPETQVASKKTIQNEKKLFFPELREPHFPLLSFHLGDLRECTTRRVDLVCRDISEQEEFGKLFLRREQIRFRLEAENACTFTFAGWTPYDESYRDEYCQNGAPEVPDPADRDQIESVYWLPDLDEIVEESGEPRDAAKVDARFLPSFLGPLQPGLIARIECNGGRLRTDDFNRSVEGNPLVWRFAPPADLTGPGSWRRAIGNSMALEFYDVRGDVTIETKRLANDVITRELVLGPAPGASRDVVEIEISNREPDLLFQDEGLSRAVLPDLDFQAFYDDLSQIRGVEEAVKKLPVPHPSKRYFFGIREKPCAGSVMVSSEEEGG